MKPKICLIDDDKIYHLFTTKLIKTITINCELLHFYDGLPALNFINENVDNPKELPEILLLDLQMKEMGGWEFLDHFSNLKLTKQITLYIVTSSVAPEDYKKSKEYALVNGFITKPLAVKQLRSIITASD